MDWLNLTLARSFVQRNLGQRYLQTVVVELLMDLVGLQFRQLLQLYRLLLSLLSLKLMKSLVDHSLYLGNLQCKHSCKSRQLGYMCHHWDMDWRNMGRQWLCRDLREARNRRADLIGYVSYGSVLEINSIAIWSLAIITACTSLTIAFETSCKRDA